MVNKKRKRTTTTTHVVTAKKVDIHLVWDLENCQIPFGKQIKETFENIELALGRNATFNIIGDPSVLTKKVRKRIYEAEPYANILMATSGVPDHGDKKMIATIYSLAASKECRDFIFITGDVDFCTTLSALRQQNFTVGVACLPQQSSPILKWVADYVLNWKELAIGNLEYLEMPRQLGMAEDDDCNKMPIHIFWDLDTCRIPDQFRSSEKEMSTLTELFQKFLRKMTYWGPFKVWTYGQSASISEKNQEILQANFFSFHPVSRVQDRRYNVDAADMIKDDAVDVMLLECRCKSAFVFISDGNLESIVQLLRVKDHEPTVVRSCFNSSGDQVIKWPDSILGE